MLDSEGLLSQASFTLACGREGEGPGPSDL